MKKIIQALVLMTTIGSSLVMASGQNSQVSTLLKKDSFFNKYSLGSFASIGLGFLSMGALEDNLSPVGLLGVGVLATSTAMIGRCTIYDDHCNHWQWPDFAEKDSGSWDLESYEPRRSSGKTMNSCFYDMKPAEDNVSYKPCTNKDIMFRCIAPTAISLGLFPIIGRWAIPISSMVFSLGVQSCLAQASEANQAQRIVKAIGPEIIRRQQQRVERRQDIIGQKNEASRYVADINNLLSLLKKKSIQAEGLAELISLRELQFKRTYNSFGYELYGKQGGVNKDFKDHFDTCNQLIDRFDSAIIKDLFAEKSCFFSKLDQFSDKVRGLVASRYISHLCYRMRYELDINKGLYLKRLQELAADESLRLSIEERSCESTCFSLIQKSEYQTLWLLCSLCNWSLSNGIKCILADNYIYYKENFGIDENEFVSLKNIYEVFVTTHDKEPVKDKLEIIYSSSRAKSARK